MKSTSLLLTFLALKLRFLCSDNFCNLEGFGGLTMHLGFVLSKFTSLQPVIQLVTAAELHCLIAFFVTFLCFMWIFLPDKALKLYMDHSLVLSCDWSRRCGRLRLCYATPWLSFTSG
jgi:hypothetical protein